LVAADVLKKPVASIFRVHRETEKCKAFTPLFLENVCDTYEQEKTVLIIVI
jgi:hypothetical protein